MSLGAQAASSPHDVADRADTVLAGLPSLRASLDVATGADGVIHGSRVKRFIDLSTVGARMAARIAGALAERGITRSIVRSVEESPAPATARWP